MESINEYILDSMKLNNIKFLFEEYESKKMNNKELIKTIKKIITNGDNKLITKN